MTDNIPRAARKPKRAWISEATMELLEHRKALAEAGLMEDARGMANMIKKAAREDKEEWIKGRLEEKFWDPIKEVTKKPSPQVVALKRGKEWGNEGQEGGPHRCMQTTKPRNNGGRRRISEKKGRRCRTRDGAMPQSAGDREL